MKTQKRLKHLCNYLIENLKKAEIKHPRLKKLGIGIDEMYHVYFAATDLTIKISFDRKRNNSFFMGYDNILEKQYIIINEQDILDDVKQVIRKIHPDNIGITYSGTLNV